MSKTAGTQREGRTRAAYSFRGAVRRHPNFTARRAPAHELWQDCGVGFSEVADASLLQSIIEELPVGVWVARLPECQTLFANEELVRIVGAPVGGGAARPYRFEDREGRPYPEERLPLYAAARRRATVGVDDLVVVRGDGTRVFVRAVARPFLDAAGETGHVVVAFRDVTAEVESSASAVVERHKLRAALEHAPIMLFAADADGMITVSEGAALEAMGVKPGERVGKSVYDVFKDNPRVIEHHRRALAGETFRTVDEMRGLVLETWLSPLRGPGGEIGGIIGVATDITERRRMELQVHRAERLAALGRLAASVGHEINNPLSYSIEALRLAGEVAETESADGRARLRELLREAAEGMERVRQITRDLRAFSRSEDEGRGAQDLAQAIATATKMVATRAGARARVEVTPGPSAFVESDPTRLVQIVVNLVLNAADALPPGGADENRIRISTRLEGDRAVVEVADNGPGVPAPLRDRVFDPFFTTKPMGEGTGLGLFVTRNLVEALGGTITLDDAPGGGARFTIRLPNINPTPDATPDATPAPPPTGAAAPPPAAAARASAPARGRVLVIDDEPQIARMFGAALASEFEVRSFTDGRAALAHLAEGAPYDLILCDLMMNDLSGREVFEEVRRARPGFEGRIVFMTGGVFDPAVADFLASVPNDCVDKPFDVRAEVRRRLAPR
jgi:PAS domain S-box-containing protein